MTSTHGGVLAIGSRFKQLSIRDDNTKLIVQLMKQSSQVGNVLFCRKLDLPWVRSRKRNVARHNGLTLDILRQGRFSPRLVTRISIGFTPKCVGKNTDRTACGSNVFNFSTRNPVVDRPTAHTNQFARFHDRNCFSVNNHRFTLNPQAGNLKLNEGKDANTTSTRPRTAYRHGMTCTVEVINSAYNSIQFLTIE